MLDAQTARIRALELRLKGWTYKRIATALGRSRQRVQQWLSPPDKVRATVVAQANGACQSCGLEVGAAGHVHHRKSQGATLDDYNDLPNLLLLCVSCHRLAHAGDYGWDPEAAMEQVNRDGGLPPPTPIQDPILARLLHPPKPHTS